MRDCGIGCSPFVYLAISLHKKAPPQFAEELLFNNSCYKGLRMDYTQSRYLRQSLRAFRTALFSEVLLSFGVLS